MIKIIEITFDEFIHRFPQHYVEQKYPVRYFIILNNDLEVGLFGIAQIEQGVADLSLKIFREYRFKTLFKNNFIYIINYPFLLGFKKVIGWTKNKSLIKLLFRMKKYGVYSMDKKPTHDLDEDKFWYELVRK